MYADTAITLLLPELERGLFDDNWRIRYSSVQLLGDLLYKISGMQIFLIQNIASSIDQDWIFLWFLWDVKNFIKQEYTRANQNFHKNCISKKGTTINKTNLKRIKGGICTFSNALLSQYVIKYVLKTAYSFRIKWNVKYVLKSMYSELN